MHLLPVIINQKLVVESTKHTSIAYFTSIKRKENIYILSFPPYHTLPTAEGSGSWNSIDKLRKRVTEWKKNNHKYLFISKDQEQGIPQFLLC